MTGQKVNNLLEFEIFFIISLSKPFSFYTSETKHTNCLFFNICLQKMKQHVIITFLHVCMYVKVDNIYMFTLSISLILVY